MNFLNKLKNIIHKQFVKIVLWQRNKNKAGKIFFKSSTTKHSMKSSCSLKISAETEKKKNEINEELRNIVKKYINTPENLIQYIQTQGIKVYKFKNADKILALLGEEEGFLTPLKGLKAIFLNMILKIKAGKIHGFGFSTEEMFIFNLNNTEIYTIARALHKYYGYKNNLPGYDYKSQEIFKKVYKKSKNHTSPFFGCTINDMYACKEAIARDLESINFTIALSVEYERSKKALEKISKNKSTNI